jgi:hypothetical protein
MLMGRRVLGMQMHAEHGMPLELPNGDRLAHGTSDAVLYYDNAEGIGVSLYEEIRLTGRLKGQPVLVRSKRLAQLVRFKKATQRSAANP